MTENLFDKEQLLKMKLEIKREQIRMLIEQRKFIQKQRDKAENEMFKLEDDILDKKVEETTLEDFKENFDKVLTQIHEAHNALRG